jgi:hypothetical protein
MNATSKCSLTSVSCGSLPRPCPAFSHPFRSLSTCMCPIPAHDQPSHLQHQSQSLCSWPPFVLGQSSLEGLPRRPHHVPETLLLAYMGWTNRWPLPSAQKRLTCANAALC